MPFKYYKRSRNKTRQDFKRADVNFFWTKVENLQRTLVIAVRDGNIVVCQRFLRDLTILFLNENSQFDTLYDYPSYHVLLRGIDNILLKLTEKKILNCKTLNEVQVKYLLNRLFHYSIV
jgi:hypothetical protein